MKRGRPKGSISTADTRFINVIKILAGDRSGEIEKCLNKNGFGLLLNRRVNVGTMWIKSNGFAFTIPKTKPKKVRAFAKRQKRPDNVEKSK